MELTFRETKFKYEDGKLFRLKYKKWTECSNRLHTNGYKQQIGINYKRFYQHRIIYLIHNSKWNIYDTKQMINHKNKKRSDDRIVNLEVVTNLQNTQDIDMSKVKGYTFFKHGRKKPYQFKFRVNGKTYQKYFSNIDEGREWLLIERRKYCYMTD
tara:strand:- start:656 stop:1120 length:465 start_codon:yes stop_codon:yes gene_type:complete